MTGLKTAPGSNPHDLDPTTTTRLLSLPPSSTIDPLDRVEQGGVLGKEGGCHLATAVDGDRHGFHVCQVG
jgi:hypothetical protein